MIYIQHLNAAHQSVRTHLWDDAQEFDHMINSNPGRMKSLCIIFFNEYIEEMEEPIIFNDFRAFVESKKHYSNQAISLEAQELILD